MTRVVLLVMQSKHTNSCGVLTLDVIRLLLLTDQRCSTRGGQNPLVIVSSVIFRSSDRSMSNPSMSSPAVSSLPRNYAILRPLT